MPVRGMIAGSETENHEATRSQGDRTAVVCRGDGNAACRGASVEKQLMVLISFTQAARKYRQPTLAALADPWLDDRRADGKRPRGVANYGDVFARFVVFVGSDVCVGAVSEETIKAYKRDLMSRVQAATARHALTVVRSFLAWCVAEGYVRENVALRVLHPTVEAPNPDPLSSEQIARLLAICDAPPRSHKATWRRNRRAVFLMLYAGLRLAEVAGLEWRDIDLRRGEITVRKEVAKGGRPRIVPIAEELDAELRVAGPRARHTFVVDQGDTPEGRKLGLTPKSLAHIFERWITGRGLDIHAHQLRKTFATELYLAGEDLITIQRLLGHADPKTTARYIGASSPKARAAVMKLKFRTPLGATAHEAAASE
jgi:integrase/recombinase XerC